MNGLLGLSAGLDLLDGGVALRQELVEVSEVELEAPSRQPAHGFRLRVQQNSQVVHRCSKITRCPAYWSARYRAVRRTRAVMPESLLIGEERIKAWAFGQPSPFHAVQREIKFVRKLITAKLVDGSGLIRRHRFHIVQNG